MVIKLGEDRVLALRATVQSGCENQPALSYDLTGATEITVKLAKADNTFLLKKLTDSSVAITSAINGQFTVALTDTETATLKTGENMSFDVEVEKGTDKRIVEFLQQLTVRR
jgi:hypothetical protein